MRKRILIDLSPGIDETLALSIALRNPNLDVMAVTACSGNVSAERAGQNLQTILQSLDPSPLPRMGVGENQDAGVPMDGSLINGRDGLGDIGMPTVELRQRPSAEKIIYDTLKAYPSEITVLALGPLTNISRALVRYPDLAELAGPIIIAGGSLSARGNATACAEFNIYCDPDAANFVFQSETVKTLLPLDVASKFQEGIELMNMLPPEETKSGRLLRMIMPPLLRNYRTHLFRERASFHATLAVMYLLYPQLFERKSLFVAVETTGDLTTGMTVCDQRIPSPFNPNMDVICEFDKTRLMSNFQEELGR